MLNKLRKRLSAGLIGVSLFLQNTMTSFAFKINANAVARDFDNYTISDLQGLMLGTTFWLLRMVGIVAVIWGVYSFISAKKQGGDSRSYAIAVTKLTLGLVLIVLPAVLKAANIITY